MDLGCCSSNSEFVKKTSTFFICKKLKPNQRVDIYHFKRQLYLFIQPRDCPLAFIPSIPPKTRLARPRGRPRRCSFCPARPATKTRHFRLSCAACCRESFQAEGRPIDEEGKIWMTKNRPSVSSQSIQNQNQNKQNQIRASNLLINICLVFHSHHTLFKSLLILSFFP